MPDYDAHPTRHDAIRVMADGMEAMAKHSERVAQENADLRKRVAELTELLTLSSAPPEVAATNENPSPFVS